LAGPAGGPCFTINPKDSPVKIVTYAATLLLAAFIAMASTQAWAVMPSSPIRHVLLISVDGLHATDLEHYVRAHPSSTLAGLTKRGVTYADAHGATPADSFPGLLAIMTGGNPAATGVYFDVSYARDLAADVASCKAGHLGTVVAFDEAADGAPDAQGRRQLDPARLPRRPGDCAPVYPHAYLRANTVFNVIHDAGGHTAWIDKHPVYEILRGPDGRGIDDLDTPEIGGDFEGSKVKPVDHITGSIDRTETYDTGKANAVIAEIDGWNHDRSRAAPVPVLFGLNLQAVNVAQKLVGYADAGGKPTPGLAQALGHCDQLLGRMVAELRAKRLLDSTLVVVTAKHGNAPIDRTALKHVGKDALRHVIENAAPGALAQLTVDQGALVWFHDPVVAAMVATTLRSQADSLGITRVLEGSEVARYFGAGAGDPRTPDLLVMASHGVIYGKPGDSKLAEHGGFDDDNTHVALLLSNPHLATAGTRWTGAVATVQIAPTLLTELGLQPNALDAVRVQRTLPLPGLAGKLH
jgi:hypothetical protein